MPVLQVLVDGTEQLAVGTLARGVEQLCGLEHDRCRAQAVVGGVIVTEQLIGHHRIGLFGKHHGKALTQVAERNHLRLQAEAVEQALQILVLNRPLQGGDTQVA